MSFFTGTYLRVLSPRTTNGLSPEIGQDGKIVFREDHLPLSAKRYLESQNKKLPDILKKTIEVVGGESPKSKR